MCWVGQERGGALTALEQAGRELGSMQAALGGRCAAAEGAAGWEAGAAPVEYAAERAARPLYRDQGLHLAVRLWNPAYCVLQ